METDELLFLVCPFCKEELYYDDRLAHYFMWVTCEYCGRNFKAKKKVRYFIE